MSELFLGDAFCPLWVKEVVSKLDGMVTAPTSCSSCNEVGLNVVSEPLNQKAQDTGVVMACLHCVIVCDTCKGQGSSEFRLRHLAFQLGY